jgi:Putative adhesin
MTIDTDRGIIDHAIGADGLLVLRLVDGDARLRGVEGDRVTVRSADGESLASFDIEPGAGSLAIRSRTDDRRASSSGDIVVDVPAAATVMVEAGSADIVAEGLTGDIRFTTTSGDLSIRDVAGSLVAEAVSGDIEIVAPGSLAVTARTVSGDLDVRAATLERLEATTTSGDLDVIGRFAGDGPFTLETVSGDATLEPVGDVRIEFTTLTGDVYGRGIGDRSSADGEPIVVGSGGGPTIVLRSTSGDLGIRPRSGPVPLPPALAEVVPPPEPPEPPEPPDAGLEILRALERGDIDVDEASRRLASLEPDAMVPGDA